MPRRRTPLTSPLAAALALALATVPSCGPPAAPPVAGPASTPPAPAADPVDLMERRVSEGIARARESAVALEYSADGAPSGARRVASGVVISEEGDVLSVRIDAPSAAAPITARVASGRKLAAEWVAADPETGLTLLRIAPKTARPATPTALGAVLGMNVLVIGNPFGLGHSVSRGFVAGLNRHVELGPRQLGGLIQVDAALHPGDSGAPLADLRGGWLGVIRSGLAAPADKDRRGREYDHDLGFAIPAPDALWVAGRLREHRRVDRAYLGVMITGTPATPGEPEGAVLRRVLADTPAERGGLKSGDRVVALDGHPVRSPYDLTDRLDRTPADAEVTVDLFRGAGPAREPKRLTLRTARRPPFEPPRPSSPPPKPKADEPRAALTRETAERIERLERRVEELEKEKRESAAAQAQQR